MNDETVKIVGVESMAQSPPSNEQNNPLRRRPSDLSLGSLASFASGLSSSSETSQLSLDDTPRKCHRRRNRRKKQKKETEDLAAKACAEMNMSREEEEQYFALDCEMVGTGYNGKHSILARVTLINWNHEVLIDDFVKPDRPVTD